jgi:hypothetical protein
MADRVQLQQVIFNLVTNAIEAMSSTAAGSRVLRLRLDLRRARPENVLLLSRTPALESNRTHWNASSSRSSRAKAKGWEWGCRFVALLLRLMVDDCGLPKIRRQAQCSNLSYPLQRNTVRELRHLLRQTKPGPKLQRNHGYSNCRTRAGPTRQAAELRHMLLSKIRETFQVGPPFIAEACAVRRCWRPREAARHS